MRKPLFGRSPDAKFSGTGMIGIAYSQETNVMLAATARGYYSTHRADSLTPLSDVSVTFNVSVTGFYRMRVRGETFFRRGDSRFLYNMQLSRLPVKFWGLGYSAADLNPRTKYTRTDAFADLKYLHRVAGPLWLGARLDIRHGKARSLDERGENYLAAAGGRHAAMSTGLGIIAEIDTRDDRYRPTRGAYLSLLTEVRPEIFGNCGSTLWHITAVADWFHPLWRGAVAAVDLYGDAWSSATPWLFWPTVGGASRLRGYYSGRYTDRKMVAAQVELRQRIKGPFGCCVWAGAGNVFASPKLFDFSKTLPNYGLGLRMHMGPRATLRVDYGLGRHSNGLIINVNEAF